MTRLYRYLTLLIALCGMAALSAPAQAVNTSFAFSGECVDCTLPIGSHSPATGLLTLSDYTLGEALSVANFVSFTYSSLKFTDFSVDTILTLTGTITGDDENQVAFDAIFDGLKYYFGTNISGGSFTLTQEFPEDVGVFGTWKQVTAPVSSAVPEPAAWALMLVGFLMMGVALRDRRNRAATAA